MQVLSDVLDVDVHGILDSFPLSSSCSILYLLAGHTPHGHIPDGIRGTFLRKGTDQHLHGQADRQGLRPLRNLVFDECDRTRLIVKIVQLADVRKQLPAMPVVQIMRHRDVLYIS